MKFNFKKNILRQIYIFVARFIRYLMPFSFMNMVFSLLVLSLILSFFVTVFVIFNFRDDLDAVMKNYWPLVAFQLAALGFVYNIRRHISEDYYKECKEQMSKAYENLNHFKDGSLDNDRLRWLTTARMLSVSNMLSKKIMISSHKIMYREEKQFWRMKFHDLVKDFPSEFYAEDPQHLMMHGSRDRPPIAEASLVEIYDFMKWSSDYVDPLEAKTFTDEEIEKMTIRGPKGLGYLLKAHREIRNKH